MFKIFQIIDWHYTNTVRFWKTMYIATELRETHATISFSDPNF